MASNPTCNSVDSRDSSGKIKTGQIQEHLPSSYAGPSIRQIYLERGYQLDHSMPKLISPTNASGQSTYMVQRLLLSLPDFHGMDMTTVDKNFGPAHCRLIGGPTWQRDSSRVCFSNALTHTDVGSSTPLP